jgi:hypothetical protein
MYLEDTVPPLLLSLPTTFRTQIPVLVCADGVSRFNSVEAYNPPTDSWRKLPPMPSRRDGCCAVVMPAPPPPVPVPVPGAGAAAGAGGAGAGGSAGAALIYVLGGYNGKRRLATAEVLDTATGQVP